MIARIIIPMLLLIVLPDLYLDLHHIRHHHVSWQKRLLWWVPCVLMVAYSVVLAATRNFVPSDIFWVDFYFLLIGLLVVPKAVFTASSAIGWLINHIAHRQRTGLSIKLGIVLAVMSLACFVYGVTIGPERLDVKRIDLYYADLPPQFNGYRIVHFSDAHVGSFSHLRSRFLKRDIDSINAQKPDLIAFTGDLQDILPQEISSRASLLRQLKAPDGVWSVLGNHDYSYYIGGTAAYRKRVEREVVRQEEALGWHLLQNANGRVRRGGDSIVICGESNYAKPKRGNIAATLKGVGQKSFIIFLQHNPIAWKEEVLPACQAQLMLAGHTHAGQLSILGLRPTRLVYPQDYGLYQHDSHYLYVTSGLGGIINFRLGATPEIAVITLHKL